MKQLGKGDEAVLEKDGDTLGSKTVAKCAVYQ